mgnify:CR=1 FL=1
MIEYKGAPLHNTIYNILVMPRQDKGLEYFLVFLENDNDRHVFMYWLENGDLRPAHDNFDGIHHISKDDLQAASDEAIKYIKAGWLPWRKNSDGNSNSEALRSKGDK